ncbi:MAG TPA: signal peptidase I, partial [Thermoanaerobaculia bacterium]|nr:signal peptidase I [Thermoanaerobaculia bacterium]
DNSHDSRFWGPVPRYLGKGRALLIYWSVAAWSVEPEPPAEAWWRRPGEALRGLWSATRWERSLTLVR